MTVIIDRDGIKPVVSATTIDGHSTACGLTHDEMSYASWRTGENVAVIVTQPRSNVDEYTPGGHRDGSGRLTLFASLADLSRAFRWARELRV